MSGDHELLVRWNDVKRDLALRMRYQRFPAALAAKYELVINLKTAKALGLSPNRLKRYAYRTGKDFAATRLHPRSALRSCRHVVASACPDGGLYCGCLGNLARACTFHGTRQVGVCGAAATVTGIAGCCARATSGHAAAAPLSTTIKSHRHRTASWPLM
jgi:hypothetical protein